MGLERDTIAICIIIVGESLIDSMYHRCRYNLFVYYLKRIMYFYNKMYLCEIDISIT
jgi:hypothetical protein